jgi:aromatic-L-amino-acid decarboxylase
MTHADEPDLEISLDPQDWERLRRLGHRMVDDMLEYLQTLRDRPVWQPMPDDLPPRFQQPLPLDPEPPETVYERFLTDILPYQLGNTHPRFWGWVIGTGSPIGMLAGMLTAGVNPNAWGGNQVAGHVERQVLTWLKEAFGFPPESSGLLVSGASMANLFALAVARNDRAGFDVRDRGLQGPDPRLRLYASAEVHSSAQKAVELLGLGARSLRKIPVGTDFRMDLAALWAAVDQDVAAGSRPICVIGTAGTVNTGAVDDLDSIGRYCREKGMWFHIDGAFGALAALSPALRPLLRGIDQADSLAFDLHKWMYMPYDVGCVLVRDETAHRSTFSLTPNYLAQAARGLAHPVFSPSDYGPELSRSFRALKVWMLLRTFGFSTYARLIEQNVDQAAWLAQRVDQEPLLERLAPAPLNIVCFRFGTRGMPDESLNALNQELLIRLQERGIAAPTQTTLQGRFALRVAITNHRSRREDFELLVRESVRLGEELVREGFN